MDKIEKGDLVRLEFKGHSFRDAYVVHMPQGEGDMWQFEDITSGTVWAQNPYAHRLDSIELVEKRGYWARKEKRNA